MRVGAGVDFIAFTVPAYRRKCRASLKANARAVGVGNAFVKADRDQEAGASLGVDDDIKIVSAGADASGASRRPRATTRSAMGGGRVAYLARIRRAVFSELSVPSRRLVKWKVGKRDRRQGIDDPNRLGIQRSTGRTGWSGIEGRSRSGVILLGLDSLAADPVHGKGGASRSSIAGVIDRVPRRFLVNVEGPVVQDRSSRRRAWPDAARVFPRVSPLYEPSSRLTNSTLRPG
jgi:hypothetical protein